MSDQDGGKRGRDDGPGQGAATTRRRRLLGGLVITLLASWLLMLSPLPYSLLSGLTGLLALVLLVPLIVQSFKEGRRALAVVSALIGVPATMMITTSALITLLFYGPMSDLQECQDAAITERAAAQCTQEAQSSVATWVTDLMGG